MSAPTDEGLGRFPEAEMADALAGINAALSRIAHCLTGESDAADTQPVQHPRDLQTILQELHAHATAKADIAALKLVHEAAMAHATALGLVALALGIG